MRDEPHNALSESPQDAWFSLDAEWLVDRVRHVERSLLDRGYAVQAVRTRHLQRLIEAVIPEWPAGGFYCRLCEPNAVGNVVSEAWASTRQAIAHRDTCPLRGFYADNWPDR